MANMANRLPNRTNPDPPFAMNPFNILNIIPPYSVTSPRARAPPAPAAPLGNAPSGIDSNLFVDDVTDVECPLCLEVLDAPVIGCDNEHPFCRACLEWQRSSNLPNRWECALCNQPLRLAVLPASELMQLLASKQRKCGNHVHGCDWSGRSDCALIHDLEVRKVQHCWKS
ncbi:hypothetical protein BT69DRAFT_1319973 [Atractiella rhizophila]|nr:hypothetical protein BT69DRAFT_1319973 [Atractiella rhizophila]